VKYLFVFIGGGIGSLSRFTFSGFIARHAGTTFPLGTLVINLIGSFLIGICFELFQDTLLPQDLKVFVMIGFLGGFTTFSSYTLESVNLIRSGEFANALFNVLVQNIAGLVFVLVGMFAFRTFLRIIR
jgi:fluoride exporter